MTTRAFYQARADECAADAAGAMLDNVRDRNLRAQAAWQGMADRLDRAESMRAVREADKQGDRDAAHALQVAEA